MTINWKKCVFGFLFIWWACGDGSLSSDPESQADSLAQNRQEEVDLRIPVHTTAVVTGSFPLQMQTNGRVFAFQKVEVKLRSEGRIEKMPFKEGDYVKAGTLLSQQEDDVWQLQLEQQLIRLKKANIDLNELMIRHGGEEDDTVSISSKHLKNFRLISGWEEARQNIRETRYKIDQTSLFAPINGWISDIKLKQHQEGNKGDGLCTLINPASFELHFRILETEGSFVELGQNVQFYGLGQPDKVYKGKVIRFDPVIDEHGLMTVIAGIQKAKHTLKEGLKVRVMIEKQIPDQIIVPRVARVIRSNRDVIFTADTADNLAKWNYVTIAYENNTHLAIGEGLIPGQWAIIDGNLNLDHDAAIRVDSFISLVQMR